MECLACKKLHERNTNIVTVGYTLVDFDDELNMSKGDDLNRSVLPQPPSERANTSNASLCALAPSICRLGSPGIFPLNLFLDFLGRSGALRPPPSL